MDKQQVVKYLEQIVKPSQILTDPLDLYVYSFEKLFETDPLAPDIVVRTLSLQETEEILELVKGSFTVARRGELNDIKNINRPLVLLDDTPTPMLQRTLEKSEVAQISWKLHESGYGSPRRLALAMKTLLLEKILAKCDACRICSGYCTVASSYGGVETWSSKGRALLIKGLLNGELPISKKMIDIIFTCTECGLCFAQCFEDLELNKVILTIRNQIIKKGYIPEIFLETARNINKTGNPGGVSTDHRISWTRNLSFRPLHETAEVLYWVGCMVSDRTPRTARAFWKILDYADVDFTMLMERESCCGYVLLSTGLWDGAKETAKEAYSQIEKTRAKTLVTPCAGCYYTFTKLYPEILGISLPCEILHSSHFIDKFVKSGGLNLKSRKLKVSYHDPCSLGRHSGVFDPPRNVLNAIPNLEFTEIPLNRELAKCCGGGGGLWSFNNRVSMESAYLRLKDLQPENVEVLATACPLCQINLRYTAIKNAVPLKVRDISEIVEPALA